MDWILYKTVKYQFPILISLKYIFFQYLFYQYWKLFSKQINNT